MYGCGDSIVDNGGVGGIFSTIDVMTVVVTTSGVSEKGESYISHPDSGVQILGAKIPQWNELLKLVEELAKVIPEQKYVGWDLTLTGSGWIMVKGNANGQLIHQYSNKVGCRV